MKEVRTAMHKANPLLHTPAMQVPNVDHFMLDHLKQESLDHMMKSWAQYSLPYYMQQGHSCAFVRPSR